MRFHVNGFSWEASKPLPGQRFVSRREAEAAMDALPATALSTSHYREAAAAFSVADYGHALSCCWAAEEAADPARWS